MTEQYKRSVEALKEFVRVHLLLLEYKRAAAPSSTIAKSYSEKSKKLTEQFKQKRRKLKNELNCKDPSHIIVEKRYREMRFLQVETLRMQRQLDELMRTRNKPAISNANEKWRTRDTSLDSEAAAAAIVAASKSGEACSHQIQFVQDRRLSDSFDFLASSHPVVSVDDAPLRNLNETFTKRAELVSHVMVDDLRRLVANEVYETEPTWLNLAESDLEVCKYITNNNNVFHGKVAVDKC